MKHGFIKRYNNCKIFNLGDCFVATNNHGLNIGQSKTMTSIEFIIDNYIKEQK